MSDFQENQFSYKKARKEENPLIYVDILIFVSLDFKLLFPYMNP